MAYTPKTWVCGEVITAEDMNHIEEGIAETTRLTKLGRKSTMRSWQDGEFCGQAVIR